MKRERRIKIIAALGPASASEEMCAKLFQAGVDVFRINMSHTQRETLPEKVAMLRSLETKFKRPVGILADLQGPKLRVGQFGGDGGAMLEKGAKFTLDSDPAPGNAKRVHLPHPEILTALEPGHNLILDDGKIRLVVEKASRTQAVTRVTIAGRLSSRKGVSLPDTTIPVSAMTDKDRSDADAAAEAEQNAAVIKDAFGTPLADGDTVSIVKDLKVKGSPTSIKVGTKVRNIRLVDGVGDHDIDCKVDGFGQMQLKSSVVKKV